MAIIICLGKRIKNNLGSIFDMRNIYIVNNSSVASQYGVGTYVEQLTKVVRERADLNLTIVQICANVENIEMRTNNGIRLFLIPSVDVQDNSFCMKGTVEIYHISFRSILIYLILMYFI